MGGQTHQLVHLQNHQSMQAVLELMEIVLLAQQVLLDHLQGMRSGAVLVFVEGLMQTVQSMSARVSRQILVSLHRFKILPTVLVLITGTVELFIVDHT